MEARNPRPYFEPRNPQISGGGFSPRPGVNVYRGRGRPQYPERGYGPGKGGYWPRQYETIPYDPPQGHHSQAYWEHFGSGVYHRGANFVRHLPVYA